MKNSQVVRAGFRRLGAVSFFILLSCCVLSAAEERPNIVLIMVDDMGFSDLGCYGGEVQTPNIDALAKNGLRFKQFYNTAKCHTTRAELLTGNYSYAIGDHRMEYGATFGEVLRTVGYRTLIAGKWHQNPLPTTRGFDRYYGLADGCSNFFNPGLKARPGEGSPGRKGKNRVRRWAIEDKVIMGYTSPDKNFYHTDAFTSYAIDRLDEYKGEGKPFLLYLPYTAPHYPLHAWPEDIAKYRGKYKVGWDEIRKQRFKRMNEMGIIGPNHKLTPRASKAWDDLSEEQKDAEDLKMAVYAAMIDRVDQNIGKLVAHLKEAKTFDNTLIFFLADNGGCQEGGMLGRGNFYDVEKRNLEHANSYGEAWANASNTPFREYKHFVHEGGISTPLIAHWPNGIKDHGTFRHEPGHLVDIMATCVDLAEAKYPAEWKTSPVHSMEGKSLVPVFGGKDLPDRPLFWEHEGNRAVRVGDWKLVAKGRNGPWELYNLKSDRSELKNLVDADAVLIYYGACLLYTSDAADE